MEKSVPALTPAQLRSVASAIAAAAGSATAILDQAGTVLAANAAFDALVGNGAGESRRSIFELGGGLWNRDDFRAAVGAVLPTKTAFDDLALPLPNSRRTIFASGRPLNVNDTGPPELVSISFDVRRAQARTEEHLSADPALALEIVATVKDPMLVLDYDHNVRWANVAYCVMFRLAPEDVSGVSIATLNGGVWDRPELHARLDAILDKDRTFDNLEFERDFDAIGKRVVRLTGKRIDHLQLILLTIEDVTDERSFSRRADTLVAELTHRAKNLLAVIQSLAFQTTGKTVDEFRAAFLGRVKAVAVAHGALVGGEWQKAELSGLVHDVMASLQKESEASVVVSGPEVTLSAPQATTFALIINELGTNALRHGAMSVRTGKVELSWEKRNDKLVLDWRESGGPKVDPEPEPSFGTRLIERTATLQLGGKAQLEFGRDGVFCRIEMQLSDLPAN
jgi:two-component sensor histidine kinase